MSGTSLVGETGAHRELSCCPRIAGQAGAAVRPCGRALHRRQRRLRRSRGHIYRYVTWRDEHLPGRDSATGRRTRSGSRSRSRSPAHGAVAAGTPVWVSKVIPDPQALPPGATGTTGPTRIDDQRPGLLPVRHALRQHDPADHHRGATRPTTRPRPARLASEHLLLRELGERPAAGPDGRRPARDDSTSTPLHQLSSDLSGAYERPRHETSRHELPDDLSRRRRHQPGRDEPVEHPRLGHEQPSRARSRSRAR